MSPSPAFPTRTFRLGCSRSSRVPVNSLLIRHNNHASARLSAPILAPWCVSSHGQRHSQVALSTDAQLDDTVTDYHMESDTTHAKTARKKKKRSPSKFKVLSHTPGAGLIRSFFAHLRSRSGHCIIYHVESWFARRSPFFSVSSPHLALRSRHTGNVDKIARSARTERESLQGPRNKD